MTTPDANVLSRSPANSFGASRYRPSPKLGGGPFAALLLENDAQRETAAAALLAGTVRSDTRWIRIANKQGTPLTLGGILRQAMAPGDVIPVVDDPRLLVSALVEPQRPAVRVLLLIEQAELIHPDALRSLQAMAPHFATGGQPSLRVVFVGRPAFRDLLRCEELSTLRQMLAQSINAPSNIAAPPRPTVELAPLPPPASGLFESVAARSAPQRWHIAGLAVAMLAAAYYVGLREPPRQVGSLPPAPASPAVQPLRPETPSSTASPMVPPVFIPSTSPSGGAAPKIATSAAPPPVTGSSPPARPPRTAARAPNRLWDFDAFLLNSGRDPAALPEAERSALFDAFLLTREHTTSYGSDPGAPNPRIVVHVPAGSAAAEALSGRLLASLGGRSGRVEERHVMDTPNQLSIRYFHPEDASAARRTADWMAGTGLSWTVRDFTSYQPRPSRGTIEVWLPRQP